MTSNPALLIGLAGFPHQANNGPLERHLLYHSNQKVVIAGFPHSGCSHLVAGAVYDGAKRVNREKGVGAAGPPDDTSHEEKPGLETLCCIQ